MATDWTPTSRSERIRAAVANIINDDGGLAIDQGETIERASVKYLQLAWTDAVRAEWQTFVDRDPEIKAQTEVAKELMKEEGYDIDPICMTPGQKAFIAKVDNQEAVCVDYCMPQVMPLSAIYVNRVRLVQSAAARVADRLAKEAAKEDPNGGWPIKTAAGEVFNSIDEMKASPNEFIRGLADSMEKAGEARAAHIADWLHPEKVVVDAGLLPTCWQYFGFDGPVSFDQLREGYREALTQARVTDPTDTQTQVAEEATKQYQNCLRELGAAIMNGAPEGTKMPPPDMAPKLRRTEACRGAAALMNALDQIGTQELEGDKKLAEIVVDAELDLRELITYALAMLALNR